MQKQSSRSDVATLSAVVHVIERLGLAMAGAMCGTFVAAQLTRANGALFDSAGFVAAMVFAGIAGFYLGIDIPHPARARSRADVVELLSAIGTFLAAIAALISVYAFVFDEALSGVSTIAVASWWLLGVAMQVAAGAIGRVRLAARSTARSSVRLVGELRQRPAEIGGG
jgi:hypothetical protein